MGERRTACLRAARACALRSALVVALLASCVVVAEHFEQLPANRVALYNNEKTLLVPFLNDATYALDTEDAAMIVHRGMYDHMAILSGHKLLYLINYFEQKLFVLSVEDVLHPRLLNVMALPPTVKPHFPYPFKIHGSALSTRGVSTLVLLDAVEEEPSTFIYGLETSGEVTLLHEELKNETCTDMCSAYHDRRVLREMDSRQLVFFIHERRFLECPEDSTLEVYGAQRDPADGQIFNRGVAITGLQGFSSAMEVIGEHVYVTHSLAPLGCQTGQAESNLTVFALNSTGAQPYELVVVQSIVLKCPSLPGDETFPVCMFSGIAFSADRRSVFVYLRRDPYDLVVLDVSQSRVPSGGFLIAFSRNDATGELSQNEVVNLSPEFSYQDELNAHTKVHLPFRGGARISDRAAWIRDVCVSENYLFALWVTPLGALNAPETALLVYRRADTTLSYHSTLPFLAYVGDILCSDDVVYLSDSRGLRVLHRVRDPPLGVSYPEVSVRAVALIDHVVTRPITIAGGAPNKYVVSPSLPDGLTFDESTGEIVGIPTQIHPLTSHVISAANDKGVVLAAVNLVVSSPPIECSFAPNKIDVDAGASNLPSSPHLDCDIPKELQSSLTPDVHIFPPHPVGFVFDRVLSRVTLAASHVVSRPGEFESTFRIKFPGTESTVKLPILVRPARIDFVRYAQPFAVYDVHRAVPPNFLLWREAPAGHSFAVTTTLPSGLSIDASTGAISGVPLAASPSTEFNVTFTSLARGEEHWLSVWIEVRPAPIRFFAYRLPHLRVAVGGSATNAPEVDPNVTVSSFSLVGDALPPDVAIDPLSGVVTATPTQTLAHALVHVLLVSADNSQANASFSIVFTEPPLAPFEYNVTSALFRVNVSAEPISPLLSRQDVRFSCNPTPPLGLSFNETTGEISGIPLAVEQRVVIVAAHAGESVMRTAVTLTVLHEPPADGSLQYTEADVTYFKGQARGTNAPIPSAATFLRFSIIPELPNGLTFDRVRGEISGTPLVAQARREYIVTGFNSGGNVSAVVYIAVVEVPPSNLRYEYSAERHQYEPFYDGFISRFVASPPLPLGTTLNVRTGIITGELFREEDVGNFTIVGHGFESTVAAVVRIDRVAVPDPAEVEDQLIYHSYSMRVANNTAVFNAPLRAPPCTFALDQNTPASLLPSGVTFETTSGTFRGTPVAPMARQLFVVRCSSRAARVFLQVFEEPRISMARYSFSLTKGEKANGLEISVTGMQSISSVTAVPRLPLGLDFNSSGQGTVEIAGTPQQVAAETTYDVIVRSALGAVARQQVILKVSENPPQAVGITNAIRSLQVGRYEEFYPAAWDSSISIGRFSIAPDPPAGMSFSDGKLFGAPTALLRAIPFTITASNSGGARSVSFFLEVTADGSAEAVRITEEVPRSGDSLPVTAAVMSLLILVLFFVVVYMLFLAWRARRRRTIAEKARETLEARIARYKAKKREEELAALEAALRAKQAEEARLRAIEEAKRKPKPLSEIGEVPDRIVDLFAKLGLKPAHAENLIRENVGVLDLPHLRTEELNALVPNAKARAKLLHYIKDVLVPYIAPPEARGWFTGEAPRSSSAEWQQAAQ